MSNIKITMMQAMYNLRKLEREIQEKYGIEIIDDGNFLKGEGGLANESDGSLNIYTNKDISFDNKHSLVPMYVDMYDFTNYVRMLYHEEQHIIQTENKMYSHDSDAIQMAMRNLACHGNKNYYNESTDRYNNNLSEIDAEKASVLKTYDFLKNTMKLYDAEKLVCDMINEKIQHSDYFIKGQFDKLSDIKDAFDKKYEEAKFQKHNILSLN